MKNESNNNHPTVSELRRERERAEMTERILSEARGMFVREGYEAVTLRKIANAIEYSPATIYQYFKDKQDLVLAIIRADYIDLSNTLLKCQTINDPLARVIEMARSYADWGISHPNHYRLLLAPPPAWTPKRQDLWQQDKPLLEQDALFLLNLVVEQGIRAGMLKEKYTDSKLIAATLWAGLHGVIMLEITAQDMGKSMIHAAQSSFEKRFNMMLEAFRDGFLR